MNRDPPSVRTFENPITFTYAARGAWPGGIGRTRFWAASHPIAEVAPDAARSIAVRATTTAVSLTLLSEDHRGGPLGCLIGNSSIVRSTAGSTSQAS